MIQHILFYSPIFLVSIATRFLPDDVNHRIQGGLIALFTLFGYLYAQERRNPVSKRAGTNPSLSVEILLLILITLAGAFLRFPFLNTIPMGISSDESSYGIFAINDRFRGVLPIWTLLEKGGISLFGPTIYGIRFPSALIGTLTIPLCWWITRFLIGPVGGIVGAGFMAFSFWHIQFSRTAFDVIMLVPFSLVLGYLLFRNSNHPFPAICIGMICGACFYCYTASIYLFGFTLAAIAMGYLLHTHQKSFRTGLLLVMALSFIITLMPFPFIGRSGAIMFHSISVAGFMELAKQSFLVFYNYLGQTPERVGLWTSHPSGAPRLSFVEIGMLVLGFSYLLWNTRINQFTRYLVVIWLLLSEAPEILPGDGIHLIRGFGALAPLAIIAGYGATNMVSRSRRYGYPILVILFVLNSCQSFIHLYSSFAKDARVKSWYSVDGMETAAYLRQLSNKHVISLYPPLDEGTNPILVFLLHDNIISGKIFPADRVPHKEQLLKVIREPVNDTPVLFIFGTGKESKNYMVRIINAMNIFNDALGYEKSGDFKAAENEYMKLISLIPRFGSAHLRLGILYLKQYRMFDAKRELYLASQAGGLKTDESKYAQALKMLNQMVIQIPPP